MSKPALTCGADNNRSIEPDKTNAHLTRQARASTRDDHVAHELLVIVTFRIDEGRDSLQRPL